MKKILNLTLVLIIIFTLGGCGDTSDKNYAGGNMFMLDISKGVSLSWVKKTRPATPQIVVTNAIPKFAIIASCPSVVPVA